MKLFNQKEYKKKWSKENKEKINLQARNWRKNNPERIKQINKRWMIKNPEYHKEYSKNRYMLNRERELERVKKWQMNNPRSNRSFSYDLQDAMNSVRLRDNNTCQWQGCNLTHRQAPIHVHHIFPRSEYPELELVEKYMICYCANHHGLWHRYRGDNYSNLINTHNFLKVYLGVFS